ncbi:MAG: 50S ribosomal protein L13 [Nanoarchaeota archaeon]|nr:50S ribosomal protein L13 [Nanoarchaeota archaeon]MBU1623043.1 50S ribosomal protein L13 [Nanoarchaeota archaeon]MBU1974227.1 50S ribosomal protein L13 [Nanoarchaeota archaeon]
MKVYNGEGMLLGRLASLVAKDALLGEEVRVVNCEKIFISGKKVTTLTNEKTKRRRKGYPLKSAKHTKLPDRIVRRSIRGMLPWKDARGREAFKRIMCYTDVPKELVGKEMIVVENASVNKLPILKSITIGDICKHLKGI